MGFFILVLAIAGSIGSVYFFQKYQAAEKKISEAKLISEQDVRALVAKVGKLIKLPEGELPIIATITDLGKWKDQPFFANAKLGDKVLLFMKAKKAFLYDPVNNLIVEVGPVILTSDNAATDSSTRAENLTVGEDIQGAQSESVKTSYNVAVYNGTSVASTLDNFLDQLQSSFPNITVVQTGNAAKRTYAKTIVVDLAGNNKTFSQDLASEIVAQISTTIPADEQPPTNADILIILGQDKNQGPLPSPTSSTP